MSEIRLWKRSSGEHVGWLRVEAFAVGDVAVDLERRLVALGGRSGGVQLWSLDALAGTE